MHHTMRGTSANQFLNDDDANQSHGSKRYSDGLEERRSHDQLLVDEHGFKVENGDVVISVVVCNASPL